MKRAIIVVLVAAVVSAALVFYLRRERSAAQEGPPQDLIALIPAHAQGVFYADLTVLRASPFFMQLGAFTPPVEVERDYAEFMAATGFDYSRDLDRAMLVGLPQAAEPRGFAIAEGRFDRDKITSYALRTGKVERHNGVDVYVVPSNAKSKPNAEVPKTVAFAFLSSNRMVLGEGASLAPILASPPGGPDAAMRERISRVAGSMAFAVGRNASLAQDLAPGGVRSEQLNNLARSLRWFSFGARPEGDRLKVFLEGESDSEENARQLAGTLDGLRLLAQTLLADPKTRQRIPPENLQAYDTLLRQLTVSREDTRVHLMLDVTSDVFKHLQPPMTSKPATASPSIH